MQDQWNLGYEQLKKYAKREGHTRVPRGLKTKGGLTLGIWVGTQRSVYKKNKLSQDRIRLLEEIGFEWQIKKN